MPPRAPKRRLLLVSHPKFHPNYLRNDLLPSLAPLKLVVDILPNYLSLITSLLPRKSLNLVLLSSNSPPVAVYGILPKDVLTFFTNYTTQQTIFKHLRKPTHPSKPFDLLFLCKDLNGDFALCYIGNRYLLPEIHLKVHAKEFVIASLFAEQFDVSPLPALFLTTKMTESHYNLPKAFHAYHKKIAPFTNSYFSIGIDKKNRIVDFAKNTNYLITHWADHQEIIARENHFHTF